MSEPDLVARASSVLGNAAAVLRAHWYLRSAELGSRPRLWGRAQINNSGTLRIGQRVRVNSAPIPVELGVGPGGLLEIGDQTFINYGCSIAAMQLVRIGARCNIGSHVIIMDNDFHRMEPERRDELPPSAPIVLEENVWVGVRAIILRGVTVGAGSVVGAASVVVRDVPPRTLVAGIPAKVIRTL